MSVHNRYNARLVAPYACQAHQSRGRLFDEPGCDMRSPFQRDRDRIIHSTAFRRLTYKTQVFIYHEGDHYRTRLTHSLEVAQIAQTLARHLGLDEDLAETIALAHDLGHPPFGHAGEEALHEVAAPFGGFDHNAQSLRTVTKLERRYASYDGLNLTWETLEGLVKHNGPLLKPDGTPIARYAAEGLPAAIVEYGQSHDLDLASYASAEAQIAALADDIAYNNHDFDDGLRAGLIEIRKLHELPLIGKFIDEIKDLYGEIADSRLIYEVNRRLISAMVFDVAGEASKRIAALSPQSVNDIHAAPNPVVSFSEAMQADLRTLREFLFVEFYYHPRVSRIMEDAQKIVRDLFGYFLDFPGKLPHEWREQAQTKEKGRVVADFVAGMTDRMALETHRRLFDDTPQLR